jgi:hypothetical protein
MKGRSRVLWLAYYNIEKRLVIAVPHWMLLGDDERLYSRCRVASIDKRLRAYSRQR